MKLDVENFERQVLTGGARTLADHRIRHIIFEDHGGETSPTVKDLQEFGYELYSLGWSMTAPQVRPISEGYRATDYESPSYLATLDSKAVFSRCSPRGWRVLHDYRRGASIGS